jgi:ABC-type polysaccharide/polyol phosphate transport system ATPase subunit/SAM-dependent methyltransferase
VSHSPVVIADNLSKRFVLQTARASTIKERVMTMVLRRAAVAPETLDALRDVTFTVDEGESVALVGRNGSGKSTLLKLIAGIHHATGGRLLVRSGLRVATMIELGVGFHPELTGRENVYLSAAIHGLSREQIDEIYPRVVAYSELGRFIETPIKTYSSGMVMRLGFATGISLNPDVFLLDEIFAVGDEAFQHKCLASMRTFRNMGKTMFFVSHSAEAVREMCGRALVLNGGRLVFDGDTDSGIRHYRRLLGGELAVMASAVPAVARQTGDGFVARPPGLHRVLVGGATWEQAGERHLAFLREQGLEPSDRLLDLGCGCLRTGVFLLPYLQRGHYVGVDHQASLIEAGVKLEAPAANVDASRGLYYVSSVTDLSIVDGLFDVIFVNGVVQDLTPELIARMFAAAIAKLAPGGRMFVAYFEAPSPAALEPIERPGPSFSFFDRPPRHVDYQSVARIAEACGGRAERLGDWGDPHGQMMMTVTRDPSLDPSRSAV